MSEGQWLERVGDWYAENPVLRGLVELLGLAPDVGPGVSVLNEAALAARDRMKLRKLRRLCDALAGGWRDLSPQLIQEEWFIHAWFSVWDVAQRKRDDEMIERSAALILYLARHGTVQPLRLEDFLNRFEEFLSILRDISLRELHLLFLLREVQQANAAPGVPASADAAKPGLSNDGWQRFAEQARQSLRIPPSQFDSMLMRLERTGLVKAPTYTLGYGGKGLGAGLTPLFDEFAAWTEREALTRQKRANSES